MKGWRDEKGLPEEEGRLLGLGLQSAKSLLGVDLSWPAVTADPQVRQEDTVALVAEVGGPAVGEVGREGLEGGQGGPGGGQVPGGGQGATLAQARQEQQEQLRGSPRHHCDCDLPICCTSRNVFVMLVYFPNSAYLCFTKYCISYFSPFGGNVKR